jgi:hypothetical protein
MPAKPQWLLQIPVIIEQLRALGIPVVDRAMCEQIFGVRRRRAIELMHWFGGYRSANTILLDRADLIERLELLKGRPEVELEQQRKKRLSGELDRLSRYRAAASVVIRVHSTHVGSLPAGVDFTPGRMTLEYTGVEDLFAKLYSLAQTAAGDLEAFRKTAESAAGCGTDLPSDGGS